MNLGLTGWPLESSFSPSLHKAALQSLGIEGEYRLYPAEGSIELVKLIDQLRNSIIDGLNVTIPHKCEIIPFMDRLTPAALGAGAVNTIRYEGQQLIGDNTDVGGFLLDLQAKFQPVPGRALILGAGGAARAVAYGLQINGWEIIIAARRIEAAEAIAESLPNGDHLTRSILLEASEIERVKEGITLVVNSTPLGMTDHSAGSAWPMNCKFPSEACLYDLVYSPAVTELMDFATQGGHEAVNGLGMLIEQAALALEGWIKQPVDRTSMYRAITEKFS
jgi:shikimate dehydrogenase